jgi:hypothetical protein
MNYTPAALISNFNFNDRFTFSAFGTKRKSLVRLAMSAFDPKRTLRPFQPRSVEV